MKREGTQISFLPGIFLRAATGKKILTLEILPVLLLYFFCSQITPASARPEVQFVVEIPFSPSFVVETPDTDRIKLVFGLHWKPICLRFGTLNIK